MLQTPSSDQQYNPSQRRFPNPASLAPFHSNLTAALQASGNGVPFSAQLSPVSQVTDLAGWDEDEDQYRLTLNTSLPEANWEYVVSYHYLTYPKLLTKECQAGTNFVD